MCGIFTLTGYILENKKVKGGLKAVKTVTTKISTYFQYSALGSLAGMTF